MINFGLICLLGYELYKTNVKLNKNSKIVGNLKIDDLDEEFWEE